MTLKIIRRPFIYFYLFIIQNQLKCLHWSSFIEMHFNTMKCHHLVAFFGRPPLPPLPPRCAGAAGSARGRILPRPRGGSVKTSSGSSSSSIVTGSRPAPTWTMQYQRQLGRSRKISWSTPGNPRQSPWLRPLQFGVLHINHLEGINAPPATWTKSSVRWHTWQKFPDDNRLRAVNVLLEDTGDLNIPYKWVGFVYIRIPMHITGGVRRKFGCGSIIVTSYATSVWWWQRRRSKLTFGVFIPSLRWKRYGHGSIWRARSCFSWKFCNIFRITIRKNRSWMR